VTLNTATGKSKMKKTLLFMALLFSACPLFATTPIKNTVNPAPVLSLQFVNLSFIVAASSARIQRLQNQPNTYLLKLNGVAPYITYVSRRPYHRTGRASMVNFLRSWNISNKYSFANINPSAVFYAGKRQEADNIANHFTILRISNPIYSTANATFQCDVTPLGYQGFVLNEADFQQAILVIN
jgi:hypothetical protein